MKVYFVGFKNLEATKKELRGREIHELPSPEDFMKISSEISSDSYICIDGTQKGTLKRAGAKELLQEIRKHLGTHVVMVKDDPKKEDYRDMIFVTLENDQDADLLISNYLKKTRGALDSFVGNSREILNLKAEAFNLAFSDPNVLILGETGTGKTLLAKIIHEVTTRPGELVSLNCAAVPETLLESELFGHARGAFTSADTSRHGLVQKANDGHMFLDEIAELPVNIQAKLLHVVEDGIYNVIGDPNPKKVDVRFISATNKDLSYLRKDLYFRLSEHVLEIPPLRQRKEDIPAISNYLFETHGYGIKFEDLSAEIQDILLSYSYPGNIRELQSILARYMNNGKLELPTKKSRSAFVRVQSSNYRNAVSESVSEMLENFRQSEELPNLLEAKEVLTEEFEKQYISQTLKSYKWNKHQTAKELGISYRYLNKLILKYGIDRRAARG